MIRQWIEEKFPGRRNYHAEQSWELQAIDCFYGVEWFGE